MQLSHEYKSSLTMAFEVPTREELHAIFEGTISKAFPNSRIATIGEFRELSRHFFTVPWQETSVGIKYLQVDGKIALFQVHLDFILADATFGYRSTLQARIDKTTKALCELVPADTTVGLHFKPDPIADSPPHQHVDCVAFGLVDNA